MKVCFWSDLHLGHANITKFRPIFSTMEEHDEFIMDTIISMKDKRTVFYILGDAFVSRNGLEKFEKLFGNVRTTLVLGNHDLEREGLSFKDLIGIVDNVQSLVKYKNFWLSHAPIHHGELRGKKNLHGHTHFELMGDSRYINVCVEYAKSPVRLEDIMSGKYTSHDKTSWMLNV